MEKKYLFVTTLCNVIQCYTLPKRMLVSYIGVLRYRFFLRVLRLVLQGQLPVNRLLFSTLKTGILT